MSKVPKLVPVSDASARQAQERDIVLLLARGEKEIAQGKGADLDAVLTDADRMLAAK